MKKKKIYLKPLTLVTLTVHSMPLCASGDIYGKKQIQLKYEVEKTNWLINFDLSDHYVPEGNASEGRAKGFTFLDDEEYE